MAVRSVDNTNNFLILKVKEFVILWGKGTKKNRIMSQE